MMRCRDLTGSFLEFEQCFQSATKFRKKIDKLETTLRAMMKCMTAVTSAMEDIGHSYVNVTEAAMVYRRSDDSTTLCRDSFGKEGTALLNTAKLLATDIREIKDGVALLEYRGSFQQNILNRIPPLREAAKKTTSAGKVAHAALQKNRKDTLITENKLKKYESKKRPISESKRYAKQENDRKNSEKVWKTESQRFMEMYDSLLVLIEQNMGVTMDHFLSTSSLFFRRMADGLQDVAPRAIHFNPSMREVFINTYRPTASCEGSSNFLPTRSTRIVHNCENTIPEAEAAAQRSGCPVEPFSNGLGAPEDPYLLNYMSADSDADGSIFLPDVPSKLEEGPPSAYPEGVISASLEMPTTNGDTVPLSAQ